MKIWGHVWISLLKPKDGGPQWASQRLQGIQLERKNDTGIELVRYHWSVIFSGNASHMSISSAAYDSLDTTV